jgi:diguanylate cyclase (GGDEF)-like protein
VLREFTRRLSAGLRQNDDFGRYGGEEFLVLIGDADRNNVLRMAERLRRHIADTPFDHDGIGLPVTASFGVAFAGRAGVSAAALLKAADGALYRAKAAGRDRCEAADIAIAADAAE